MELRQLQYFVKVARKQHVTQAAEELHVAQSAVSRQIRQLEEELGVQLFVQKGRNLQITAVGKLFLSRIEAVLTDLERAVNEIHEYLDPEHGEIRVGFPHSLGIYLLPTVIAHFRKNHPKVKFRLRQGTYNSLIRDVMKGEIDLAFISPFPEKHSHVAGELLLREELYAIVPQGHVLCEYQTIRLEQLKEDSFVMFSEEYSLRAIVLEACRKAGFSPRIGFEGEETDTIRGLVAAGMGVSLLPEMALTEISELQPVKVRVIEPQVTRSIGLIHRTGEKLPLVAEVFREFLIDFFIRYK
ncbi:MULTISPECIES: LysR family transcriptional regulator [Paenibacillus]|uniref:LysR family transcriptional regulator n=1 Tax=Paenibacillus naphthalenovorans TaxID=162209 RepID=A0A0U2U3W1_9BACL|nr:MULTISPECIES: LysR family transcriptional regulator [Paenibacillus]ALS21016.1 LysR family transcriptional regulator [Paenibacillus naphthalenovorans]NTZ18756.1 LysR family transcriptional regulator [Paenibacillus sp. JMULE4]GCL71051.1 LysR family transcriptional regulator [Paenibacillus naphthalenovorans]SDI61628.1 DNA-binding transcriptional regulator, LysR family [Paenibacillus naphthalenovorans]